MSGRTAGRAERRTISAGSQGNGSSIPPSRSTSRPNGPLAWARTGTGTSHSGSARVEVVDEKEANMATPSIETVRGWRGRVMVDRDRDKIGEVVDIYLDNETE